MIALPRPAAAVDDLPQNKLMQGKSEVHIRMRIDRELLSKRIAVNSATLNVFRNLGAYVDIQQQLHARRVLVSSFCTPRRRISSDCETLSVSPMAMPGRLSSKSL